MLAVSHLWLRTAPMSGEEGPSPVGCPRADVPGVDVPGSGLTDPGHWPARGRPGVGTHPGATLTKV